MSPRKTDEFNFEKSLSELEKIVKDLENGGLNLEAALKNFENGVSLVRKCQTALSDAEQRVEILTRQSGSDNLEPYEDE